MDGIGVGGIGGVMGSVGSVGSVGLSGVVGAGAATAPTEAGATYNMSGMQQPAKADGLLSKSELTDALLLALLLNSTGKQGSADATDAAVALLAVTAIKAYDSMQAMALSLAATPVASGFQVKV